jgi:hypothetical protein
LRKAASGFVPRSAAEIETLVSAAYGEHVRASDLLRGIDVVAQALNRGDIARAKIAAVLTATPELDWDAAARLARAEDRLSKYSPDQSRDWHGRWTTGDGGEADHDKAVVAANDLAANEESFEHHSETVHDSFIASQDSPDEDEPAPPDKRSPLERKYDDLGPVEFSKQVIQFGWNLGTDGQGFSPDQRQDALAEYNFLQDRLDFWLAYDNKPLEAQSNLLSAAFNLYSGAVNGGIITIGRKDGELPASMLPVATGILAADNGTPTVGLRGPAGGVEVEAEPVPPEHPPASSEEEPAPSRGQLAPAGPHPIIEELTRTGELGDNISNAEAKIDWDSGTDKGLHWENYNEAKYPEFTKLKPGSKVFDFFDETSGEAVSDKALDPLSYSYINEPKTVYSTVKRYIDAAAKYNKQRVKSDVDPATINSRSLRLGVRNYISPAQWDNLYRAVRYARSRGVKIKIWRVD